MHKVDRVCLSVPAGRSQHAGSAPEVRSLELPSQSPSRCARRQALVLGWGTVPAGTAANLGGLSFFPVLIQGAPRDLSMFTYDTKPP